MAESREIVVNRVLTTADLAQLLGASPVQVIATAFQELGWLLTVPERLELNRVEAVASEFGFVARRGPGYPRDKD